MLRTTDEYLCYVCGPLTTDANRNPVDKAEQLANVNRAIEIGFWLQLMGYDVIIPHLNWIYGEHLKSLGFEFGWEDWYKQWDFTLLDRCRYLYFIDPSHGSDDELERAEALGLVIFRDFSEVPFVERVEC